VASRLKKERLKKEVIKRTISIVTSIHPDFNSRVWKHAKGVAGAGHEVHLVCPWQVPSGEVREGVHFHTFKPVPSRALRPFLLPVRVLRRLLPLLSRVQLVHFHDLDILPWMALLSFFKPVVYDVHENYPEEMMVKYWIPDSLRHVLRFTVYWAQFLFSMKIRNVVLVAPSYDSGFTNPYFRKMYFRNLATLELLRDFVPDYQARPQAVIFTGWQYDNNGTLLYLDIAELCKDTLPGVPFYMTDRFMDTAFRDQVLDSIKRRELTNVEFMPCVEPQHIMQVMNRATIAVIPSLRVLKQIKAFRTKTCEYMAASLPIVASDLPQEIEMVGENNCGILAQPENPQSFADGIASLAGDRERALRLGKNGQDAFREKYSWESELPKLLAFYEQILGD
jgi:glycosyltransferase involved in cell wall biosynthesis